MGIPVGALIEVAKMLFLGLIEGCLFDVTRWLFKLLLLQF